MADLASDAVDFVIKLKDDSVVNSSTVVPLNDQLTFQFNVNREKVPGGESCKVTESTGYQSKGGPDKELLDVGSADDCKSICKEDPLCKAVDYFATMKFCHLFHRVITLLSYSSKYVHYDIDCGSVTVTQCEASNGQSGDNKENMKLIENSCPSEVVGKLMGKDLTQVTNNQVVFKMHPFKFNHNNAISIECTVKVCSGGTSAECPIPDCRGLTRKRRSADRSDERVRRTIFILDPEFKSTRKSDSSKNKSVSVNDVTTPIVAGIAIVIILLLVCIVVLLVVKKRRSNQKSQDEGVNNHTI
ncbi:uncharacterized protein LOC121386684 [Gigantopelta aegis]|uniref:uncharacterized protein LOC121386684 n=1 Tax=Gigantopelta aegis TaxID=1735272 RepID=UPI001B887ACC|nr:uncharacterized protein LOC121386684 [Gigantopelta aegis]